MHPVKALAPGVPYSLLSAKGQRPFPLHKNIAWPIAVTAFVMLFKTKPVTQLLDLDSSSKAAKTPVNQLSGKSFTNGKKLVASPVVIPMVFWSLGGEKSCRFSLTPCFMAA